MPSPGPLQAQLLAKPTLTFADYQTAMQAAASCMEEASPGVVATLTPHATFPQVLDWGVGTKAKPGGGAAPPVQPQDSSAPSPQASPSAAGSSGGKISSPVPMPSDIVAFANGNANCLAVYSAWVEARWQKQQVLSAAQVSEQLPQVVHCLKAAGVRLPAHATGAQLAAIVDSPGWSQGLNNQQSDRGDACLQKYALFFNTFL